jgi:DNA-binding CsgD family transcriptional regulator
MSTSTTPMASDLSRCAQDPQRARGFALRALAGAADPGQESWLPYTAAMVLLYLDEFDVARRVLRDAIETARVRGSAFAFALGPSFMAVMRLLTGDLAGAEADARSATETATLHELGWLQALSRAYLASIQLEAGEIEGAAATLRDAGQPEQVDGLFPLQIFRFVRGRVRATHGDLPGALSDFQSVADRIGAVGIRNAGELPWRSHTALLLHRDGQTDAGRDLANQEIAITAGWGSHRAHAASLRLAAAISPAQQALSLLQTASEAIAHSPAVLERMAVLADLGAAQRRASHRAAARETLTEALDLAVTCGATEAERRIRTELLATGARPRRAARSGADALTASERRVAALAAAGASNRTIAQDLFVTPRTVELHLTNAYRKLGIAGRSRLAEAIGPEESDPRRAE